jgi:hypothetical protein
MFKKIKQNAVKYGMRVLVDALSNDDQFTTMLRNKMAASPYIPHLTKEEFDLMIEAIMTIVQVLVLKRVTDEYKQ